MRLRNKAFQAQTEAENRRKLDIVLRSLTNDQLTVRQRHLIAYSIGCRRQYSFQLCQKPDFLPNAADTDVEQTVIRQFFGNAKGGKKRPAAVLVQRPVQDETANTVYIYLPEKKEEQRDDARKKETAAQ